MKNFSIEMILGNRKIKVEHFQLKRKEKFHIVQETTENREISAHCELSEQRSRGDIKIFKKYFVNSFTYSVWCDGECCEFLG